MVKFLPSVAIICSALVSLSSCHDLFNDDHQQPIGHPHSRHQKRVAIIGAGSAGASTAYYLSSYAVAAHLPLNLTIYESASYIGGRSTTVNAHDDPTSPIELGASIFVSVNHNLVNAVKAFNLSVDGFGGKRDGEEETLGIWNGAEFVWIQPLGGPRWKSWWSRAKLLYRYGLAPLRTVDLMREVVARFLKMYDAPYFPWRDLSQVAYDVGLTEVTAMTGEQYLEANGIGDSFAREVVQASTRVNYAQNLAGIHGLETMVCMATDGAMSVEGGNWQIFEGMMKSSGATVFLNTSVIEVRKEKHGRFSIVTAPDANSEAELYDAVVLAAPYQFADLSITPEPRRIPDKIDYVNLHVTLFTTSSPLSPSFFGLDSTATVPDAILTTLQPSEHTPTGVGLAGFFSISAVGSTVNPHTGQAENVYKIFSPEEISAEFLCRLLGSPLQSCDHEPSKITWLHRKVWQSYPYLPPRITFEELEMDHGLWYTAGIESFISTMETSSLMGMNVARLIVDGWMEGKGNDSLDMARLLPVAQ